jgi:hypothetical protein
MNLTACADLDTPRKRLEPGPYAATWANVGGCGGRRPPTSWHAEIAWSTHAPPRPPAYATRGLGRAVSDHEDAFIHLAREMAGGLDPVEGDLTVARTNH